MKPLDADVLAIDVGSSCVKLGWFPAPGACTAAGEESGGGAGLPHEFAITAPLATPEEMTRIEHRGGGDWLPAVERWIDEHATCAAARCLVSAVHPDAARTLFAALERRPWVALQRLSTADLPLEIRTLEPQRTGIDRLLGAVAANRLRPTNLPAITVDMGTAVTVNLIAADGAFEGGAIMAGPVLALGALHAGTASLPRLDASVLAAPPAAVGKSTAQAMAAGAFWGAVGGVRALVAECAAPLATTPALFVTGGGSYAAFAQLCPPGWPARHVTHLVLAGIRVVAESLPAP